MIIAHVSIIFTITLKNRAHESRILTITTMIRTHGSIMLIKTRENRIVTKTLIANMLIPMSSLTVEEPYHRINILIAISIYRFTKTQRSNI